MTSTDELVEHLASHDIRRLPSDEIQTELEFARREVTLADSPDYREYLTKRVMALSREQERRKPLHEGPKPTGLTVEFIRDLKGRIDIEDVFGSMLGILCLGRRPRLTYRCPAHSDRHPSGVLYTDQGRYHCYQCHADGDSFDALMAFKRLTFLEAVDAVAGYLGVELPKAKPARKGGVAL